MRQPLLAEEMMDLTLEELIEDHGADLVVEEHWYGVEWSLRLSGTVIYTGLHYTEFNY